MKAKTMPFDPDKHHRRSIRLATYDYRQSGVYAITLVSHQRHCLFGEVIRDEVLLSTLGCIVEECWEAIPKHIPYVELGLFVVMPNHLHGILMIDIPNEIIDEAMHDRRAHHRPRGTASRSLGAVISSFKSIATKRINQMRETPQAPVWQRNYYEHIIRNDRDLDNQRQYILYNPAKWTEDSEYIDNA